MTTTSYHPDIGPDPTDWLAMPEAERVRAVHAFHRAERLPSRRASAHAAFHVAVENQLARGNGPMRRALHRLLDEGLSRHEVVHALGWVMGQHHPEGDHQRQLNAALDRLTAQSWRLALGR